MANVVKKFDLLRSYKVKSDVNSHKLYWIDIIDTNGDGYRVKAYAQLVSDNGYNEPRIYNLGTYGNYSEAIKRAESKYFLKTKSGYMSIKIRDNEYDHVDMSHSEILQFLSKYA